MISYCHPPLSKLSLFLATVITTAGAFYVSQAKRRGGGEGGGSLILLRLRMIYLKTIRRSVIDTSLGWRFIVAYGLLENTSEKRNGLFHCSIKKDGM